VIGSTHSRRYNRTETGVQVTGEPYEENSELIDLFISLLENNPARLAVERGDDLRELIMRPVDTTEIEQRIQRLQRERDELTDTVDRVERRSKQLPALEEQRQTLTAELESLEAEIESLRSAVTQYEADAEMAEEAEELVDKLDERRKERSELTDQIDLVTAEIEALRERPEELRAERDELPEHSQADLETVQEELRSVRNRKRELENTAADLSAIVEFNEDILSDSISNLPEESASDDPVAELAPESDQEVTCWTCGNRAERGAIADRLENLRNVVTEKRTDSTELESRITELEHEQEAIRAAIEDRTELDRKLDDIDRKLEAKVERKESLEEEAEAVRETISELETNVADTEELRDSDLLETYERISELQYEQGQTQQELKRPLKTKSRRSNRCRTNRRCKSNSTRSVRNSTTSADGWPNSSPNQSRSSTSIWMKCWTSSTTETSPGSGSREKKRKAGVTARIRRSTFTWSESRTRDPYTRIRSRI